MQADKAKRVTQAERVLAWLEYRADNSLWVSGLEFTNLTKPILCYTKRISELRAAGHKIDKRWNAKGFWEYKLVRK